MTIIHLDINTVVQQAQTIRDQDQTISRLRSTIERIRKQRNELLDNEGLLQAEIIGLRDENKELKAQLFVESKKELCVGQVWFDEYDNTYEIIGIRGDVVSYYYQDNCESCSVTVASFKEHRAHKLLGDA